MNTTAILAYAQRILRAGDTYAIIRRNERVLFSDAFIALDLTNEPIPRLVPHLMAATPEQRRADYAVSFGDNPHYGNPDKLFGCYDGWAAETQSTPLTLTSERIEVPALHINWRTRTDTAIRCARPGDAGHANHPIYVNQRLLDLILPKGPYSQNTYAFDMLANLQIRVYVAQRLAAILMPVARWQIGQASA